MPFCCPFLTSIGPFWAKNPGILDKNGPRAPRIFPFSTLFCRKGMICFGLERLGPMGGRRAELGGHRIRAHGGHSGSPTALRARTAPRLRKRRAICCRTMHPCAEIRGTRRQKRDGRRQCQQLKPQQPDLPHKRRRMLPRRRQCGAVPHNV